ncbi:MAG: response regulator [Planctomycetales bacterium]|nr:response regulator [Planctomycetales bacterium]
MNQQTLRVLVIEDNPGDARLIAALLSVANTAVFAVESAETLASGIARLRDDKFDAVLLDLNLPDSSGLQTFLDLQAEIESVPIVVLSGLGDEELGLRAVKEGAQDYLIKGKVETDVLERSLRYALERKRSEEAIRRQTHELQRNEKLLRQLLDIQERERQLVAYDIHDGFVQDVVGAKMMLDSLEHKLEATDESRIRLATARELLQKAIDEGRRMISELRPLIIDEQGIVEAIHYLINEEQSKGDLSLEFHHSVRFTRLPRLLEGALFRIVQEGLTNVRRHSQAATASITLVQREGGISLCIDDAGIGFDAARISDDRFGVRGIQERARLFGGTAKVQSSPGEGTHIEVEFPLSEADLEDV